MSIVGQKIGTKAWSDTPQNEISHKSGSNLNSASDLEKLGGQEVGDVLNKIADPNYVDPLKKVRAVGNDKLDKDAFMKLMLAQMKNQDPTNPLKSHEMAAQLAQFSSVEQMQNMNNTLTDMAKAQKPSEGFQALNFIGKSVSGDSAKLVRAKGDKDHEFNFALPADAADVEVKVRNSDGEIVRKVALHGLKQGQNSWTWNGKNEIGNASPVGEYSFIIEAKTAAGKKLAVKTDFNGMISGINYTAEGPVLLVGTQTVKIKDVRRIVDPSIKNNDQKPNKVGGPDLKTGGAASQTNTKAEVEEDKGAGEAPPSPANMMTNVGMSNGMMEKFKNDLSPTPGPVIKPETKPEQKAEATQDQKTLAARHAGAKAPSSGG